MHFRHSLLLVAAIWAGSLHATRVNWVHYPKVNPWTFELDEVRYQNHSNVRPEEIQKLIDSENTTLDPSQRMMLAALRIQKRPFAAEKKAVLMRDCFDAITRVHGGNWAALDAQYTDSVGFVGSMLGNDRFLLLISLKEGKFYRGNVLCEELLLNNWQPDLDNQSRWRPVVER